MTHQIGIYNFSTKENIVRDMTSEEIADYELKLQETAKIELAKAEKESRRNAILEKLGLSQSEANLLLGVSEELKTDEANTL